MSTELIATRLSNKDKAMLHLAMKIAESSSGCNKKHGAVIVRGGSVLSVGFNKWRNRPPMLFNSLPKDELKMLTIHAEVDALSHLKDAAGATIYVARVNKNSEPRYSRPCDDCYAAIKAAGIKKIVYTVNDMDI